MRHLFIDTFYLVALAHPRDQWHERVLTFSRSLGAHRLYTVEEVLAEFLTACSASKNVLRTPVFSTHAVLRQ
jgi:predicted nucleic acid-binding protein